MNKFGTQICIISDQVDANLIPVLSKETRPNQLILLVSEKMQSRARDFVEAVKSLVKCEIVDVKDIYDIDAIETLMLEVCSGLDIQNTVVNITGGTKPMSIACFSICSQLKIPFFYMGTDNVVQLFIPGLVDSDKPRVTKSILNLDLSEKHFFNHYIKAHGFNSVQSGEQYRYLSEGQQEAFFARVMTGDMSKAIFALNGLSANARNKTLTIEIEKKFIPEKLNSLLDVLTDFGWVEVKKTQNEGHLSLAYRDEDIRRFLNGIWLELYVEKQLKAILPSVRIYRGLKAEAQRYSNELDLVFFYENKVYVIEAKTLDFSDSDNSRQDIIHKLKSVTSNFGGLNARSCLISFQKLPPYLLDRAVDAGIFVIQGNDLRPETSLQGKLKQWIQ